MKRIVLFVHICVLCSTMVVAQQTPLISPLSIPPQRSDMPEWATYLYQQPTNFFALDSAYTAYYATHEFVKNNYTKFYKRFRSRYAPFIQNNGVVREIHESDITRIESKHRNTTQSPTAEKWKAIGPFETYRPANGGATQTLLPWQANIYAFDISLSNPNILYCVSETGGFFKSTNKGIQWTQLEPNVYSNSDAVAIHPTNPNIVYVGISNGILRTTNGGTSWQRIWTVQGLWVYDIEVSRADANVIFASTTTGFYRTSDAGITWIKTLDAPCCDIETNPENSNEVYTLRYNSAAKRYEFYKSTNAGVSFSLKSSGWLNTIASEGGGRLAVTNAAPNNVYCVLLGESNTPYILRSENKGDTWRITARGNTDSLKMNNGQGYYDLSIAVSGTDPNKVIVGTQTTYRSDNGGFTFSAVGGYAGPFPIHPDLQEVRCHGGDCYTATDGGISYSTDCFTEIKNAECRTIGLNGADFWGFDSGWNEDVLVGGRYHNGNTAWHENYGTTYFSMGGGEAATGYVHPIENTKMYFSDLGGRIIPREKNGVIQNTPIAKFPNESYYHLEHSEMAWDPTCYNILWLGNKNTLWKSTNGGNSFDSVWASSDAGAVIEHIEIARSNPRTMYCSQRSNTLNDGKIWRSTDAGSTWKACNTLPNTSNAERRIMQISVSGTNESIIYCALLTGSAENKVFMSTNGGNTWQNLTTPTIAKVGIVDMIHQLGTNDGIYIAGSFGEVYYRNKQTAEWQEHGTSLPYAHITRALKAFYRDGKLRSGSSLGIWEIALAERSKPIAQPSVDKRITSCARDTFYFDSYSVAEKTNLTFSWSFPGASYVSDSTARNPRVVYAKEGVYGVSLTVSNIDGTNTYTNPSFVTVLPSACDLDTVAGRCLDLSSNTSIATIPTLPQLANNSGFTVSMWVKLNAIQPSFSQLLSNWSSDVGFSFGFSFQGYRANTNLTFYWKNVPYQLTSPYNLPINEWTHVALTVNKEKNVVTLYVNGTPWEYTNKNANFTAFNLASTPWELGGGLPGQGGNFNGQMDELRMYARCLSTNEIREQLHLTFAPSNDTTQYAAPVAYFQFNEANDARFYNRLGAIHSSNGGGALAISTAPLSHGSSSLLQNTSTTKQSLLPPVVAQTPTVDSSVVAVYRLLAPPDSLPQTSVTRYSPFYWIVRSWGKQPQFATTSLSLSAIGQFSPTDNAAPQNFVAFKRSNPNEHKNIWFTKEINAHDSTTRTITFAADSNAIGHYIIATKGDSPLDVQESNTNSGNFPFALYPNPSSSTTILYWNSPTISSSQCTVQISSLLGAELQSIQLTSSTTTLQLQTLPIGTYVVTVKAGNKVFATLLQHIP